MTILGQLRAFDGKGAVHLEDTFDTTIDDLWTAITEPERLARWYGRIEGDLRPGSEFTLFVEASQWDGAGRIEVCEPPNRLRVICRQSDEAWQDGDEPYEEITEATRSGARRRAALRGTGPGVPRTGGRSDLDVLA